MKIDLGRKFLATVLLIIVWTIPATASSLFVPLPESRIAGADAHENAHRGVIRSRNVAIDGTYLASRIAPQGVDHAADRLDLAPAAAPVRMELFPGVAVDLNRTSLTEAFGGGFVWTGEAQGGLAGTADLVIVDGKITGHVSVGPFGRRFRIEPLPVDGAHRISEIDGSAFPGDIQIEVAQPAGPAQRSDAPQNTRTEITVLVAYTQRANTLLGNPVAQANLAVSMANSAYQRSNVMIDLRLVGTHLVTGYDEAAAASYNQVLYDLTDGRSSGPFLPVHQKRDSLGSDLVALLIDRREYCGLAWMPMPPTASSSMYGMSLTTWDCISNQTFAHEIGHNMGLSHDRYVVDPAPNTEYNFGYVDLVGRFRDIMSYTNACTAASISCPRIDNFSNPAVSHNGRPTGISAGNANAADGARALNENRAAIAAYRATPTPPVTTSIVAAVTPVARRGVVNSQLTAFAALINTGSAAATSCTIAKPAGGQPYSFAFAERIGGGSSLGPTNQAVNIPAGATRHFLMTYVPTAAMSANLQMVFDCTNTSPAPTYLGVNSFNLVATTTAGADLIAIAATPTGDGILRVPPNGAAAAATAAINIGTTATVRARLSTTPVGGSTVTLPLMLNLCRTNTSGACVQPAAPTNAPIDFSAPANGVATFSAFVNHSGAAIPFDPATRRLYIHFEQASGTSWIPVGSASVAVTTAAAGDDIAALAN